MKITCLMCAVVAVAVLGCTKKNDNLHPNTFEENTYAHNIRSSDSTYHSSGTFFILEAKPCEMSKQEILIQFDGSFSLVFSYTGSTFTVGDPHECMSDAMSFTYRKVLR